MMRSFEERFFEKFPNLKGNPAVETFLHKPEHQELIEDYLSSPTQERMDHLDKAFKAYYFGIRFTSYLNTSLYFHSVNFDKKVRQFAERNRLTLDQSVGDEEGETFKDQLYDQGSLYTETPRTLEECIEDDDLLRAYLRLSDKQRGVLDMTYVHQMKDSEIANHTHTSQQAVSKLRKKALMKLKNALTKQKE
ncbi:MULTISPECIES: sigma-70 family RNA polymerase sigma factor [Pontibacillus]|uniref:Sigma-70 family RNA polymerase sigma factor n=1 Tax=Pontibacillus chungwhensis TaxID=265426 RepID=A0ABY8UYY0_9BACI|nr:MULTISPECIES: sigma-70 family RNA polymerase sigma factor [Pontibacillus]MCD5324927.1 sigma-70 family RNA polymerase sigma factor [Pontibacillus sp. HN14]WIF98886.1 sigma-70 family RNA polymerase sigma factor [Pontibacillus chungwhensis]